MSNARLRAKCEERLRLDGVPAEERHAYFVPGRIEVLGKHTDYAGGRSLLAAVERGIFLIAAPRPDERVVVRDAVSGDRCVCLLRPDLEPVAGWANYAVTVVRRVARDFPEGLRGADLAFASDLPSAAGLSSSSALVIAIFLGLSAVNELDATATYRANITSSAELADYLAAVESGRSYRALHGDFGVGTRGGSQDHTAILCSRAGQLLQCAFAPVRIERFVHLPGDLVFAIGVSGVTAEKTRDAGASYNRAVEQMERVTELWRARLGRDSPLLDLDAVAIERLRDVLRASDVEHGSVGGLLARADQFIAETQEIIPAAVTALGDGDLATFGTLVDRSQQLAITALGNQVDETVVLARTARKLGAVAASAFGAGFGGSVWALVTTSRAASFVERWRAAYLGRFPMRAADALFFTTPPGAPAGLVAESQNTRSHLLPGAAP